MLSLILSCLVWATYVLSQDFAIPTSWREPTSNTSFVERALLAETVLNTISVDLNTGQNQYLFYNQNANLFSAVALLDLITHNSTNHALVSAAFRAVATAQPGFVTPIDMHYNVDPLTWGLAAIRAYHAYGDTYFLDTATTIWQNISSYQVSTANGANKIPVPKQSAIQSQCNGTTTAGAVFVIANNPTDLTSNAATTGSFMDLSSRLFEVTQNATYRDAAQLASDFIQFHLYNGKTILDTINLSNCTSNLAEETYNPGLYIGGLSVLVNQTQNATMGNFLNNLISNSIKNPTWTGPDGVITEGPTTDIEANYDGSAFKGIFIRELYEAWSRTSKDSDVAKLIQSYVMVQFNALLELAKAPDNDYFSPLWHGPADPKLIPQGQLSALDVFNAAAGMANVEARPSEPTPTPPVHKQSKAGVIAGSVIGVAAFIAIVALLVVYLVRRRWRSRYGTPDSDEAQVWTSVSASPHTPEIGVTPFSQLSPASNAGIPEKLRNDMDFGHDPTTPTSQIAGSSAVPVSVPRQSTLPESSVNPPSTANAGSDTIPELVQRLNVAIAQLPPRSGGDDASTVSDVPPVYTRSL